MIRPVSGFAGVLALVAFIGDQDALANSRFTVQNDTDRSLRVVVFSGNDSVCVTQEKKRNVSPGSTRGIGCTGGGKQRCKIDVDIAGSAAWEGICLGFENGCSNTVIRMPNGSKLTVKKNRTCSLVIP